MYNVDVHVCCLNCISLLLDTVSMHFIGLNTNLAYLSKSIGKVLVLIGIAILLRNSIGIGIANTFISKYWYWYCQYVFPVLLTALATMDAEK